MRNVVKFELKELLGIGMTFVVLGIGIAYGLEVIGDIKDDLGVDACGMTGVNSESFTYSSSGNQCINGSSAADIGLPPTTAEYNATVDSITGVSKITSKLPTIATIVVAAVILGILVTYLWARFR